MTLRARLILRIVALVLALLLLSAASLWGINALHEDFSFALRANERLQRTFQVASRLATARTLLSSSRPDQAAALREVQTASSLMRLYTGGDPAAVAPEPTDRNRLQAAVDAAERAIQRAASGTAGDEETGAELAAVDDALRQMGTHAGRIQRSIIETQDAAARRKRTTMTWMLVLCGGFSLVAICLGIAQYRGVMRPLRQLAAGVRHIAGGNFEQRIDASGRDELASLAAEFNRMAAQLEDLYRGLEQQVDARSRQLVRSERLASVGHLAAGVAHEINNPLGIIAGYAELAIKKLGNGAPDAAALQQSLRVICEEAFRCKEITSKLLSLARGGDEQQRRVDLGALAATVAETVGGLGEYRQKRVTVHRDGFGADDLVVMGSEGELKQVVLNLLLNALEAVEPKKGEVRVELSRREGWVEMALADNGRGMDQSTIERIFEPFFTTRPAGAAPGTGLGLSITHAIVENHDGRISATSAGPGRGSRFIVQLPPAGPEEKK